MAKYIIEMPEGWKYNGVEDCPLTEHGCGEFGACIDGCPLANAKVAVEVTGDNDVEHIHQSHMVNNKWVGADHVDGKPVKLYAVDEQGTK